MSTAVLKIICYHSRLKHTINPFIKAATGNISTEDMVFMSGQMGIETGVDIDKIAAISRSLEEYFSKQFSGKMHCVIDRKDIQVVR